MDTDPSSSVADSAAQSDSIPKLAGSDSLAPPIKQNVGLNLDVIKEVLEIGGKSVIGLAGLCYILGLMVVTIHLNSYGLNSLTLSQLHYVTAGVWVMIPVLAGMCCVLFVKFFFESQQSKELKKFLKERAKIENKKLPLKDRVKSKLKKVFLSLGVLFIFFYIFYVNAADLGQYFGVHAAEFGWHGVLSWVAIPALGTVAFASIGAVIFSLLSQANQRRASKESDREELVGGGFMFAVIGIFLSVLYLGLFAGHTYRDIPWATGGGRPSQVELVVTTDAKPYLESVGIKFSAGQNRTDSLKLLLATEKDYVIISPDGKAVSVPSDSVKAVLYER